jgi:homocysteine S-methyltransferase
MSQYRDRLPQLAGGLFVTDGGLETDLIFRHGAQLLFNAAYTLLETDAGIDLLAQYFADYVAIAQEHILGVVLESATWRASPDWAAKIGTSPERLTELQRRAVDMLVAAGGRRMLRHW